MNTSTELNSTASSANSKGLERTRFSIDEPDLDIETIQHEASRYTETGALTSGYSADVEAVINLLNDALATELVCVLRYKQGYYMATGFAAQQVANELLEHAEEEQHHADLLASRIVQLGGRPDFSPDTLTARSHAQFGDHTDTSLAKTITENLIAERVAIDTYRKMIQYVGNDDPTTRRMLEEILADEEEHADDLASFIGRFAA